MMIALIVGAEAVLLGYGLALRLPDAEIREGPGDKDDGRSGALFAVGELEAVHPQVPQRRGVIGPRLPGEATTEHHEGKPDGSEPAPHRLLAHYVAMVMGGGTLPGAASIIAQRWLTAGANFDGIARTMEQIEQLLAWNEKYDRQRRTGEVEAGDPVAS
jgi:hypothetical protein